MRYYFVLAFLLLTVGCKTPAVQENWTPGEVDSKTNNILVCWLADKREGNPKGANDPVFLKSSYGSLIVWDQKTKTGKYYLFNNKNNSYFGTTDADKFIKEVKKRPDILVVDDVNSCTVPQTSGMPAKLYDKVYGAMKKKRWVLRSSGSGGTGFCYCEYAGIKYLDTDSK